MYIVIKTNNSTDVSEVIDEFISEATAIATVEFQRRHFGEFYTYHHELAE
jgi:hypothetical protein